MTANDSSIQHTVTVFEYVYIKIAAVNGLLYVLHKTLIRHCIDTFNV